jgi:hypothetical protein
MSDTTKTFQWLKGDKAGQFVRWNGDILDDGGMNFLIFTDGSRGNEELLGDYFIEVANEQDGFVDSTMMQPQPNSLPRENNPPLQRVQPTAPEPPQLSPIAKLLKDSKKNKNAIDIEIVVDIPPADLMRILAESYDDGEQQVLDYLASNVNAEDLRNQIAKQIWLQAFKVKTKKEKNEATA